MKVWALMDNIACSGEFQSEHGLSYYIETEKHRILFDAGETAAFARNAEKLGIDLDSVDFAVLSHGHSDHGGGLSHFLQRNDHAKVYVARTAFEEHFNPAGGYIGLSAELLQSDRLVFVDGDLKLDDGVEIVLPVAPSGLESTLPSGSGNGAGSTLHSDVDSNVLARSEGGAEKYPLKHPVETFGLCAYRDGRVQPDSFDHEQYLMIREQRKTVLFSGCSHRGILNIVSWFHPDVLFGGFHYFRMDTCGEDATKLRAYAAELLTYPTMYYTGHCTGREQYEFLSFVMGDRLRYFAAGECVAI